MIYFLTIFLLTKTSSRGYTISDVNVIIFFSSLLIFRQNKLECFECLSLDGSFTLAKFVSETVSDSTMKQYVSLTAASFFLYSNLILWDWCASMSRIDFGGIHFLFFRTEWDFKKILVQSNSSSSIKNPGHVKNELYYWKRVVLKGNK